MFKTCFEGVGHNFLSVQFHSFNQIRHSKGSELTLTSVYVVFFFHYQMFQMMFSLLL